MSRNPQNLVFAALAGALLCAGAAAYATSGSGTNYKNCVAQKTAVAKRYCKAHGTQCTAAIKAARRECRTEVSKGLRFTTSRLVAQGGESQGMQ